MTFDARESSRAQGEPISLYFFRYGDTPDAYYAYTDAEQEIDFEFDAETGLVAFAPIPIDRDAMSSSGSLDKAALTVKIPHDTELSVLFRMHPPSQVISLTIWNAHADDTDYKVVWIGRVLGWQILGNEAEFTCEPISTSMRRAGLRRNYQYGCPHALYGPQCKANKPAATITTTVTDVAGALVSVPGGFATTPMKPKYIGGIAEWTHTDGRTEQRTIIRYLDSDTIILSGVALGLTVGALIKLSLGCDHKWDSDCINLHNNVQNFGGDPWIPLKNPIGIVNNFY